MSDSILGRCASLLALVLACFHVGCGSAVVVPLRVSVTSPIDLAAYPTFAVVPIVDQDRRLDSEELYALSNMVRQELEHVHGVTMIAESETLDALGSDPITLENIDDPDKISVWGGLLGASAVVTGRIRYYVFNDIQTRPVEWCDQRQERYVSQMQTYLVRTQRLTMRLRVYDARTGKKLVGKVLHGRSSQPQSLAGVVFQEIAGSSNVAVRLATEPVREFVRLIAPHFEYEERYLVR